MPALGCLRLNEHHAWRLLYSQLLGFVVLFRQRNTWAWSAVAWCTSPSYVGSAIFSPACPLHVTQLASSQRAPYPGATGLRNMGGPWSGKGPCCYCLTNCQMLPSQHGGCLGAVSPLPREPTPRNRREGLPSDPYPVQTQLPSHCRNIRVLSQVVAQGSPCVLRLPS